MDSKFNEPWSCDKGKLLLKGDSRPFGVEPYHERIVACVNAL